MQTRGDIFLTNHRLVFSSDHKCAEDLRSDADTTYIQEEEAGTTGSASAGSNFGFSRMQLHSNVPKDFNMVVSPQIMLFFLSFFPPFFALFLPSSRSYPSLQSLSHSPLSPRIHLPSFSII
jgi:hypothetical protein